MDVKEVQRRLWEQSKAHRENREASMPLFPTSPYDKRVRNLSDLIHHPAWLGAAAERVFRRSKNKAPGVDGVTVTKFLDLLRLFLKAGVIVKGNFCPTVKGVPQGGVASPLLANVVLNKLDWFLHEKGKHGKALQRTYLRGEPNIRFVRYADDWCVFLTRANKHYAASLREQIREFLKCQCGLRLSHEKTRVTHVRDGFNFLGFRLEQGIGQKGKRVPKIKVGQKALTNIRLRLNEATRYRPAQESVAARIQRASAVIRGWSNYFKIAHNFSAQSGTLDHLAHWAMVKAICRKNDMSTKKVHNKFYYDGRIGVSPERRLVRFSDTKMSLDFRGPKEYEPGKGEYLEDNEQEADLRIPDAVRRGAMDLKLEVLRRDNYSCCNCGGLVIEKTSHLDHIKPVKCFASYEQANTLANVQTLCLHCHKQKTRLEQKKA